MNNLELFLEFQTLEKALCELEEDLKKHDSDWAELNDLTEDDIDSESLLISLSELDDNYSFLSQAKRDFMPIYNSVKEEWNRRDLGVFYTYSELEKAGQMTIPEELFEALPSAQLVFLPSSPQ